MVILESTLQNMPSSTPFNVPIVILNCLSNTKYLSIKEKLVRGTPENMRKSLEMLGYAVKCTMVRRLMTPFYFSIAHIGRNYNGHILHKRLRSLTQHGGYMTTEGNDFAKTRGLIEPALSRYVTFVDTCIYTEVTSS